jgi:cell division septation protein DedD
MSRNRVMSADFHSPARFGSAVRLVLAVSVVALVMSAEPLSAQHHAPAVAVTSTPAGAVPSIGSGAFGSKRLTLGVRYGRLTDQFIQPANEESAESRESYERDVYTVELSTGLFGGAFRMQIGRSHTRYRFEQADTLLLASPTGSMAMAGWSRPVLDYGLSRLRFGVASDMSAGWADLGGESAVSAHAQLPVTMRVGFGSASVTGWGAPGMAFGALRGESAAIPTAAAGVRVEIPGGTAIDIAGSRIMGDYDAVWGGRRVRASVGITHSFGMTADRQRIPQQRPGSPRRRYSAAAQRTDSAKAAATVVASAATPSQAPAPTSSAAATAPAPAPAANTVAAAPAAVTTVASAAPQRANPAPAPVPRNASPASAGSAQSPRANEPVEVRGTIPPANAVRNGPPTSQRSIFYQPEPSPAPAATQIASPASSTAASAAARTAPAAAPAPRASSTPARNPQRFTVQAAAKKTPEEAMQLSRELEAAGFPARIVSGSDYHRVRIGRFTTRAAAQQLATRLRGANFDAWVTNAED